ncbi:MAG: hypothetical protein H6974_08535 [Gammaproteobacteria bacterium]|nr:hypothetical protein [Gammaproteobacteria bacterium]
MKSFEKKNFDNKMKWIILFSVFILFIFIFKHVVKYHFTPINWNDVSLVGGCPQNSSPFLKQESALKFSAITYCAGGDLAIDSVVISFPKKYLDRFIFFTSGYIRDDENRVTLNIKREGGESAKLLVKPAHESWIPISIHIPASWKMKEDEMLFVELTDASEEYTGWGGIGLKQAEIINSYIKFLITALSVLVIVFMPGIFINNISFRKINSEFLAIPGLLILSVIGFLFWIIPQVFYFKILIIFIFFLLFVITITTVKSLKNTIGYINRLEFLFFLCIFTQGLLIGINPMPVAQEFFRGTSMPSRMVASPPDHAIPYQTAAYFFHRKDGIEDRERYFGQWSVTSRGPLVPLGINALFHFYGEYPDDPPNLNLSVWPLGEGGSHIARIYGWLCNALVIFGVFRLMSAMRASEFATAVALLWTALSPVVLINVVFLWPKLLAAFFLLLAMADAIEKKYLRSGFFLALAWLSHPIGALFFPVFLFYIFIADFFGNMWKGTAWRDWLSKNQFSGWAIFLLAVIITMIPWIAYKQYIGYPDVFFKYFLSDGRGILPAENFTSWLDTRWRNFWLTLSPAAFYFSDNMKSWLDGEIPNYLRWTIQYAKTLPGQVGFSMFLIAYRVILNDCLYITKKSRKLKFYLFFIWSAFLLMIVFWGFSNDGLGRNSLEPLTLFIIALSCFYFNFNFKILAVSFTFLLLENRWIEFSGFYFDKDYSSGYVGLESLILFFLSTILSVVMLIFGLKYIDKIQSKRAAFLG